jgi:hypothetical protein
MSFYLEPSTESTDLFFNKIVDPIWLAESQDSNAIGLRSLQQRLARLDDNAREKAWRIFHRVTYVSRVLESVDMAGKAPDGSEAEKKSVQVDVTANWMLISKLEPFIREAQDRATLAELTTTALRTCYPTLCNDKASRDVLVDFLAAHFDIT